jgi:hypothetical protein
MDLLGPAYAFLKNYTLLHFKTIEFSRFDFHLYFVLFNASERS